MTEAEYRNAQQRFLAANLYPPNSPAVAFGLAWLAYRYGYRLFESRQPLPAAWGLTDLTAQPIRDQVDAFLPKVDHP